jgi:uncharacterized protein YkwD
MRVLVVIMIVCLVVMGGSVIARQRQRQEVPVQKAVLVDVKPAATMKPRELNMFDIEQHVLAHTNALRVQHGLTPLIVDQSIMDSARRHAQKMASSNVMRHGGFNGGENIAMGQSTPASVVKDWTDSPGHRRNMLGGYTYIGVAACQRSNGQIFWCQQFK